MRSGALGMAIAFISMLSLPMATNADLAAAINLAATSALADTNLIIKDKKVFLYGVHTNGADTHKGKYGCAKVVSVTLRKAGMSIPILLGVAGIESALKGWEKVSDADKLLPGDVVVWVSRFKGNPNGACTGGGTCHVGIRSDKGYFHNNPLGYQPIYGGMGLWLGYKFKQGFRPPPGMRN